jgi:hypothetical protein
MIANPAPVCHAFGCDLSETITPGEHLDGGIPEMDLDPITIELDLMNPAFAGRHLVD